MEQVKVTILLLALLGVLMTGYAVTMPAFKDPELVARAQLNSPLEEGQSYKAASDQYITIREEQLTPKFKLEDYGWTALITAGLLCLLSMTYKLKNYSDFRAVTTPRTRWQVFILGILASFLFVGGYVVWMWLENERAAHAISETPLGILIFIMAPLIFGGEVVIVVILSLFGLRGYKGGLVVAKTETTVMRRLFFGLPLVLSFFQFVACVFVGLFPMLPGLLFCSLFFLFLLSGRAREETL